MGAVPMSRVAKVVGNTMQCLALWLLAMELYGQTPTLKDVITSPTLENINILRASDLKTFNILNFN